MKNLAVAPGGSGLPLSMGFQKPELGSRDFSDVLSHSLAQSNPVSGSHSSFQKPPTHSKNPTQKPGEKQGLTQSLKVKDLSGKERSMGMENKGEVENKELKTKDFSLTEEVKEVEGSGNPLQNELLQEVNAEGVLRYFGLTENEIHEVLSSMDLLGEAESLSGAELLKSMGFAQADITKILELYNTDLLTGNSIPGLESADRESILANMLGKTLGESEIVSEAKPGSKEMGALTNQKVVNWGDEEETDLEKKLQSQEGVEAPEESEGLPKVNRSSERPELLSQVKQAVDGVKKILYPTENRGEIDKKKLSVHEEGVITGSDIDTNTNTNTDSDEMFEIKEQGVFSEPKEFKGVNRISSQEIVNSKEVDSLIVNNKNNTADAASAIKETEESHFNGKTKKSLFSENSLMEQVTNKAASFIKSGKEKISIRLNPPSLGNLQIKVESDSSSTVRVTMVVESAMVKSVIESNANELRQALAEQGIFAEEFSVSVNSGESFERHETLADDSSLGEDSQDKFTDEEENETKLVTLTSTSLNLESLSIFA